MLATSDAVLSAWLSPARQLRGRIKVKDTMYESEEFTSLSFDSGSISGETYQIGSTYMNTVKVVFPSILEEVAEDVEIVPEIAVLVDDEYHYTKLGHFYVTEFDRDRNANTTTLTASDKMIYMEGSYASRLTFPKSYREVALEIANLAGVEVDENSFATLQNLSIAKPEGYTHRQAIGLIAQFEGGFASFNREGKLEIRRLRPTEFGVTPESYLLKGFRKNENAYRIGGITVRIGDEESATLHVGSTNGSQVMLENKVMTQALLDLMWVQVKDLIYFPFDLKWRGCPALEAGDWMYVTDRNGTRYSVPNLSYSINFNGGMSAESKATTDSSSQATYKYRGPLSQKIDYIDNLLSSNGWNQNYYDATEPTNPKEGDIWFKPNGQDTEIWIYEKDADGNLSWVLQVSTAPDPELVEAIEEVGKEVEQAQSDSAAALENANSAVNKANEASAKAEQSQQTAEQAKSDATNAAGKAQSALDSAGQAVSSATDALNQAALAKSQAEDAINKYLAMGMVPAWSWSPDGTDRFTTVEPGENLLDNSLSLENSETMSLSRWANGSSTVEKSGSVMHVIVGAEVPQTGYSIVFKPETVPKNTKYSFGIDVKGTGSIRLTCLIRAKDNSVLVNWAVLDSFALTDTYKRLKGFITTPDHDNIKEMQFAFYPQGGGSESWQTKPKLEISTAPTIYTPSPSEDYSNAIPSYIGFAIEPSDNPADYTWIRNPEKVEGEVKVELTDINGELSRKVSQETFDQLNGTVINHSTLISQNQNEIKQKASQESVNTLTGRVTTAEGSISTIAGQVALKANQTEVDTIAGRVTSAESQLTVQAGKITAINTLTDGHTSQIGSLQSSYSGLSSTVSKVQNDLNGLSVGGRNYVLNTADGFRATGNGNSNQYPAGIDNIPINPDVLGKDATIQYKLTISNYESGSFVNLKLYDAVGIWSTHGGKIDISGNGTWMVQWKGTLRPLKDGGRPEIDFNTNLKADILIEELRFNAGNLYQDWEPAPEDMATVSQMSSLTQTVDSINTTVINNNTNTQSQITQLSNQITSVVGSSGQQNLVFNSDFRVGTEGWSKTANGTQNGNNLRWSSHLNDSHNGSYALVIDSRSSTDKWVGWNCTKRIKVTPGYKISLGVWIKPLSAGSNVGLEYNFYKDATSGRTTWYQAWAPEPNAVEKWQQAKAENVTVPADMNYISISFFNYAQAWAAYSQPMVTFAETLGAYSPDSVSQSQITQLTDAINLRVQKGDVINQINISPESILIAGQKVHITGQTTIDSAVIKTAHIADAAITSAKIGSLSADKITAGTLNGGNVNIINLNADNIVSGKLDASLVNVANLNATNITSGTLNAARIGAGAITADKIASNAITADKISAGAITASKIASKAITADKLNVTELSALSSDLGTVTAARIENDYFELQAYGGVQPRIILKTIPSSLTPQYGVKINPQNISFYSESSTATQGISRVSGGLLISNSDKENDTGILLSVASATTITVKRNQTTITGSLNVTASKNAIHPTRDGVRATPAYELAESYLGDIGRSYTDETCMSIVPIEVLFSDTVNLDIPYEVFLQAYDDAHFWVSDFTSTYFVVKSDKPMMRFAWELKAKRRGYENERLVLNKDFNNKEIDETWREAV